MKLVVCAFDDSTGVPDRIVRLREANAHGRKGHGIKLNTREIDYLLNLFK
jgi:hypothetical protein